MADQYIGLAADGPGKKIDSSELTVSSQTVNRERMNLASPTVAAAIAEIVNTTPGETAYGVIARALLNAIGRGANPAQVGDGASVPVMADRLGKLIVLPFAQPDQIVASNVTLTTTTSTVVLAASGAGIRTYLCQIHMSNTSATGVRCDIKDGTTVRFSSFLAASGGGIAETLFCPFPGTANTTWEAQLSAAVTDVRVTLIGFKAP